MRFLVLLLVFNFLSFSSPPLLIEEHPIYISMAEIDYKADKKRLEISIKLFADDLELVLGNIKKERIEVGTDREHPRLKEYLVEYLQEHFRISADNRLLQLNYVGKKTGGRADIFALYVFVEVKDLEPFKILEINNSIFLDFIPTQLNFSACHSSKGLVKVIAQKGETLNKITW